MYIFDSVSPAFSFSKYHRHPICSTSPELSLLPICSPSAYLYFHRLHSQLPLISLPLSLLAYSMVTLVQLGQPALPLRPVGKYTTTRIPLSCQSSLEQQIPIEKSPPFVNFPLSPKDHVYHFPYVELQC